MDIGTPVLHLDDDDNTYAGLICGRDFEMRSVFRDKAGKVLYNPDGTLADKARPLPAGKTDTVSTEKVETGLFNVASWHRDGTFKFLVVSPEDLSPVPAFDSAPVFSHAPVDTGTVAPPVVAPPVVAPPVVAPTTVDPAAVAAAMADPAVQAAVAAAMAKQGA